MAKQKKEYSPEYLKALLHYAKKYLPEWIFKDLHKAAMSQAGGKVRWKLEDPFTTIEKMALQKMTKGVLSTINKEETEDLWYRLNVWFDTATKSKEPTGFIVDISKKTLEQMGKLGLKADKKKDSVLLQEIDKVEEPDEKIEKALQPISMGFERPALYRTIWVPNFGLYAAQSFTEQVYSMLLEDSKEDILLMINSYGGNVDGLLAMLDVMDSAPVDFRTCSVGASMSCGAIILSNGTPGKRYCLANSTVMIHEVSTFNWGNVADIKNYAQETERINTLAMGILAKNMGKTLQDLKKLLRGPEGKREIFLNSKDTLRLGVADKIVSDFMDLVPSIPEGMEEDIKKSKSLSETLKKTIPILQTDGKKQIVYGVPLDPYQFDAHKDLVPPVDVEEYAHSFISVEEKLITLEHKTEVDASLVESSILPYPSTADYKAAMNGKPHRVFKFKLGPEKNQFAYSGAWLTGIKVYEEETWEAIEKGELTEFSVGGYGQRFQVDENTDPMELVTEVIDVELFKKEKE